MKILFVDDHKILFEGIKTWILNSLPQSTKVFFACSPHQAISKLDSVHIDIIISDLEFSNDNTYDGFLFCEYIKKEFPNIKMIAFSHFDSYLTIKKSMSSGFNSYLSKNSNENDIIEVIEELKNKNVIFETRVMKEAKKKRFSFFRKKFNFSHDSMLTLSEQQLQLLYYIGKHPLKHDAINAFEKRMNKCIPERTLNHHIQKLKDRLHLENYNEVEFFAKEFHQQIKKYIPPS